MDSRESARDLGSTVNKQTNWDSGATQIMQVRSILGKQEY